MMGFVSCCVINFFDTCGSGYSTADPKVDPKVIGLGLTVRVVVVELFNKYLLGKKWLR